MISSDAQTVQVLLPGMLRRVHHIALHVKDMEAFASFLWGGFGVAGTDGRGSSFNTEALV